MQVLKLPEGRVQTGQTQYEKVFQRSRISSNIVPSDTERARQELTVQWKLS